MHLPLIGITTYHRNEKGYIKLGGKYADAVRRANGLPLLIQPGESQLDQLMNVLDGLILSGGGDVGPVHYTDESHPAIYGVNEERDQTEFALAQAALEAEMPLFCICRGLQLLNVTLGGTLIAHIPDVSPGSILHREEPSAPTEHEVELSTDSQLAEVMQTTQIKVASWHHQGIDCLADSLRAVAHAADGLIEAVELPGKPVFAVQWHPELTAAKDATQQKMFDEFVRLAAERKTL